MRLIGAAALILVCAGTTTAVEPRPWQADPALTGALTSLLQRMSLTPVVRAHRLAVSLVDVTDLGSPRYAGVNDTDMMYAASLPKIGILLAGFEKIKAGKLEYTPEVRGIFTRMIRYSSNPDSSRAVQMIGFDWIATTLAGQKYQFYDPKLNGGLWVGKAYGGASDYWRRDPLHNLSHGATTLQTARFFTMLAQGRLVDEESCRELKELFSKPGIHHKFVKGLAGISGVEIYRKSGTWRQWHSDAALIEHDGRRYVAVALMDHPEGSRTLERLIVGLDEIIVRSGLGRTRADEGVD